MQGKSPQLPFVNRIPFYYGWLMVPIAIIAQAVTGVGQTYGISVFNPSLLETLQISLSALTGTYMVGTLLAAVPQPYIGSIMDRYGIRRTMIGVVLLLGGACIFFSRVDSLVGLLIGFFLLRLLGQGALSLLSGNIPAMWFQEKLGTVTGIISSGFSLSMAVIPPFFLYLINLNGWRSAYARLGFFVWLIMLPLLFLIFRNTPEEVGQLIDGMQKESQSPDDSESEYDFSFTPQQARKTSAYWIAMINHSLWAMIITAVFFNLLSIFQDLGITPEVAAATYTTYAAASLITQLSLGSLANKGPLQMLMMFCMGSLAAGIGLLTVATTPLIAHSYAVLVGISTGLISLVGGTIFARYYGITHLGKLRGVVLTAQVAGSSLGPFITGLIYDLTGSFQLSLWIFVVILVPVALISLKAVQPPRPILMPEME